MPNFDICIKVIGKKSVSVEAEDKDEAYKMVNAQALEHVTTSRSPMNPADWSWKGVMSMASPEWQCHCGRVLDYECDRCAKCGHVAVDGAEFIYDYDAETFECPECGHVNYPADGDCCGCPDCGADANEAMSFNPGDKRITFPMEESLRQRAEIAERERDAMLEVAERFAPCPFVLFPDSDKRLYKEDCATCQPKKEKRLGCLREWAHQQAHQKD